MRKKGAAQVDWIISLVIFLLYISWFFVYMRPVVQPATLDAKTLLLNVEQGFERNGTWSVTTLPLFVDSNLSGNETLFVDFSRNWSNFTFSDNHTFVRRGGRLMFVSTLQDGMNVFTLAHSTQNYTFAFDLQEIAATASSVSVDNGTFSASFDDGLLEGISFAGKRRLVTFNLSMGGKAIQPAPEAASFNTVPLLAEYGVNVQQFNQTAYVLAEFPRIYTYVRPNQTFEERNLTIAARLGNYTRYHVTNADAGGIEEGCTSRHARYIDVSDARDGISFIFSSAANITLCGGDVIDLHATFAIRNDTRYDILMHEGDHNATTRHLFPYTTRFGLPTNVTGIGLHNVERMNGTVYSTIKEQWGFPASRDFKWTLLDNETVVYAMGKEPPALADIFVMEKKMSVVDKYGTRKQHVLRVKGW